MGMSSAGSLKKISILLRLFLFFRTLGDVHLVPTGVREALLRDHDHLKLQNKTSVDMQYLHWPGRILLVTTELSEKPDLTDTLKEKNPESSSRVQESGNHSYYASKLHGASDPTSKNLWVNFDVMDKGEVKIHAILSTAHRQVARVNLSFSFPFYGHTLQEVMVATGGFIYTGDLVHRMLTATQYVAPLMANFNPSISRNSSVLYFDNGTALVVQWDHVRLQDNYNFGSFTFQATLHSDGRIIFAYKEVPVPVSWIDSTNHPVKVGLSDAFVVFHQIQQLHNVHKSTVYEYHRVALPKEHISSSTAVEMRPLPTCLQLSSCDSCISSQIGFQCSWCSRLQRCSSGFDRHHQDWVESGCSSQPKLLSCSGVSRDLQLPSVTTMVDAKAAVRNGSKAAASLTSTTVGPSGFPTTRCNDDPKMSFLLDRSRAVPNKSMAGGAAAVEQEEEKDDDDDKENEEGMTRSGLIVGILLALLSMATLVLVTICLYHHHTSSGSLFFLERHSIHWPSMKFRRSSGNPTYAEVEPPSQEKEGFVIMFEVLATEGGCPA